MKARHVRIVNGSVLVVALIGGLAVSGAAVGQEPKVTERLFRSRLTSVTPVFAPGQAGNLNAVIGFDTESVVYEINEPIEKGVIPKPRQSEAEPIGRMHGELRLPAGERVDKSKPMQIFAGTAKFVSRGMRFEGRGTSIIHWCQDGNGQYSGIRWTDFSGTITNIEGRHQGVKDTWSAPAC